MKTSRAVARDFSLCAEGVNNEGRVSLRSVLYLLYLKHDQKIDHIRKNNDSCLYLLRFFLLRAEARGGAYPVLDFHWFVLLND